MSEAAPQRRARGPSSGRERGSALSTPCRSSAGRCAPSTSPQIRDPVRRQVVKPQVAHLQTSDLVHPHACQRCHCRQQARPVRRQRRGPPCEQPTHHGLLDRQFQCQRPTVNRAQHLNPRRVPVVLTELLAELKLPVARLNRLPHQLDLRARDCKANHVPCQRLERVQRHEQDVVHHLARHRPCDDQPPRPPIVRLRARLPARRREVLVEGRRRMHGDCRASARRGPSCRQRAHARWVPSRPERYARGRRDLKRRRDAARLGIRGLGAT
jgi:hypothetical protein